MAIRCSSPGTIIPRKTTSALPRVVMLHQERIKPSRHSTISSKSIRISKVFEDQGKGIVCYRDENGEITCEGYDEGPRFSQQAAQDIYHRRQKRFLTSDLRRLLVLEDIDVHFAKGLAAQEQN